jgi:alpha-mannosidase
MNNYWDTNYRAGQGGHFSFHYVVTSASSTDVQNLSRMGWEEVTPLETDVVTSQDKAVLRSEPDAHAVTVRHPELQPEASCSQGLDDKQQSFVEIDDPNIVLETLKTAEDGNGFILRLLDLGGTERTVSAKIPCLRPERVWQTDAVERGQLPVSMEENGQFDFTVHPSEIVTLRIIGGSK